MAIKKIQSAGPEPNDSNISAWLDGLVASTDETLLPEYSSDKSRGWTPDNPNLSQGPAPFAISKNQVGQFELILFGTAANFRRISSSSRVQNKVYEEPSTGNKFTCTTIRYDESQRNLLEILLKNLIMENRKDSDISPVTVCTMVLPWIETGVLDSGELLSDAEQLGLYGELYLLRRLLNLATKEKIPHIEVLNRWSGPEAEKRDFADTDQSEDNLTIAVEAKATSSGGREHRISSVSQLNYTDLELYVFSMNVRQSNSGTENLLDIVIDIRNNHINKDCLPIFDEKLANYGSGFLPEHTRSYERVKKYTLHDDYGPALYRINEETQAMTKNSFDETHWEQKQWSNVQYTLNLTGTAHVVDSDLSNDLAPDTKDILLRMTKPNP